MNVSQVMDQVGRSLEGVGDLRVFAYPAPNVVPPAAFVGWPDEIDYAATFAPGAVTLTLPVLIVVGKADVRSARDAIAAYLDSTGPSSAVKAIEGGRYTACDAVRVTGARVEPVSVAGIEYLAALLDVAIVGQGAR